MISSETILINGDGQHLFPLLRNVKLRGTNFDIGRRLAEINIANHGDSLEKHRSANPLYVRARRAYLQANFPIIWQRLCGVADAFGVDPEDDRFDFTGLWHNIDLPPRPGCSNAFFPPSRTADGHAYLSRNYEFSTGSAADVAGIPLPPAVRAQMKAMMGEPYIMEWEPTDGGYTSWAIHANDLLGGAFDGINSQGLAVALMADEDALKQNYEPHMGPVHAVGLHELQIVRTLLDTCANVEEAKQLLLTTLQYYLFVPCHYIIADASGASFIFEHSMGRNHALILDGGGDPQVCTNHQIYRQQVEQAPALTPETNSQWRYATLRNRIDELEDATREEIRACSAAVGVKAMFAEMTSDPTFVSIAANINSRTLWYALYDLTERRVEIDFYLGEQPAEKGAFHEQRSEPLVFQVSPLPLAV